MKAVSDTLWFSGSIIFAKFAGLISQIVLGWILTKEEFGIYAIVNSLILSVAVFRNGGTQQILVQRGGDYGDFARKVFYFSLMFNLLAFAFLNVVGVAAAKFYDVEELWPLCFIMGLSIVFTTPTLILKARAQIVDEIKFLSFALASSNIARQFLVIVLAIFGFGVFSFVVPAAIEPLILGAVLFSLIRQFPKGSFPTIGEIRALFADSRWVMLSNFAVALRQNGQYFAISLFESSASLGVYFFSMQLITSGVTVFTSAIEEVAFPKLSSIKSSQETYERAFFAGVKYALVIGILIAISVYAFLPQVIHIVWAGKWDTATFNVVFLAAGVPSIILATFCLTILASRGLWKARLVGIGLLAVGDACVAGTCAYVGSIETVSFVITIYRTLAAVLFVYSIARLLRVDMVRLGQLVASVSVPAIFLIALLFHDYFQEVMLSPISKGVLVVATVFYYWMLVFRRGWLAA